MNITTNIYLSMGRSCIDYEKLNRNYVWYNQVTRKGNWTMMLHVNEGGWGFHCWTTNINNKTVKVRYSAADANAMVADGSIVTNAVFDRGVSAMFKTAMTDFEVADILAFHIPAVSSPAGKVRTLPDASRCYDLNSDLRLDRWGRSHDGGSEEKAPWLHSDIKNMSYFYVYPAFNEILEKGNLK